MGLAALTLHYTVIEDIVLSGLLSPFEKVIWQIPTLLEPLQSVHSARLLPLSSQLKPACLAQVLINKKRPVQR